MSLGIPIPTPTMGEIISYLKRPKLIVFVPQNEPKAQNLCGVTRAFYHIGVKNVGKTSVKNARVYLNFESTNVRILAKWDFKPEPFDSYSDGPPRIVPWLIVDSQVHDILPASAETFAILMKYQGEDEIYPFSAFSYLYRDLKEPHNRLGIGEYTVKAYLYSENYWGYFAFKVKNNGRSINDVSIEPIYQYGRDKNFKPIRWE